MMTRRTPWFATLLLALAGCGGGEPADDATPLASAASPLASPLAAPAATDRAEPALGKALPSEPGASQIVFGGQTFEVRSGEGGPGPNAWSAQNVWVDAKGRLHLKIAYRDGQWSCAEIYTTQPLGFGTYTFKIAGHPEALGDNVVLGLFNYPTPDIGPDGTNEIDIEFATWGGAQPQHGNWTVWPAVEGHPPTTFAFDPASRSSPSTFAFDWSADRVTYMAYGREKPRRVDRYDALWTFAPPNPQVLVPQHAMPLHLNLWLFQGKPPADGKDVEVIVTGLQYTPATR